MNYEEECERGSEYEGNVLIEENENCLMKIPTDVLIYEILAHYYLEINKTTILKMNEFSLLGYFTLDPSRNIFFLFRNIIIDDKCPEFGILGSENCPIIPIEEIERIRFQNYPYIHEFYEKSISWLNLRELEIHHNLPIKPDWFSRKDCFPSLEIFTIVDNAAKLGIGRRGRRGRLGRTSLDRKKYLPLLPNYLQNVDEKLSNKNQTFDSSNFRRLKKISFENYDELISTTLSSPSSFSSECFKNLEEIKITNSKDFRMSPLIKAKLTYLHSNLKNLKWTVMDIFPKLKSLELNNSGNEEKIIFNHECFPSLERLILFYFGFKDTSKCSLPPSLKFLFLHGCSGKILVRNDLQLRNLEHLELKGFGEGYYSRLGKHTKPESERLVRSTFNLINFDKLKTFVYEDSTINGSLIPWNLLCLGLEKLVLRDVLLDDSHLEKFVFRKMKYLDILNVGWISHKVGRKFGEFPNLETFSFLNNANHAFVDRESLPHNYDSFITIGKNTNIKRNLYIKESTAGCFESNSKIRVLRDDQERIVAIKNIQVGDLVESSEGKFEKIIMIRNHRSQKHLVLSIDKGLLLVTANHLFYSYSPKNKSIKLISARSCLLRRKNDDNNNKLYLIDRLNKLVMIDSIEFLKEKKYVDNVYTRSGRIVVNGFLCSVYSSEWEKKMYLPNLLSQSLFGEKKTSKIRKFVSKTIK